MQDLTESMKKVLATSFAFYLKAHYYHWNVEGPDFKQYHDLFGDIYEEVYGSIDAVAEEIRALDAYAPGSFSRFAQLSSIQDETVIPDNLTMAKRLLDDTNTLIELLTKTFDMAEEYRKIGLSDFLAGRVDAMNKHAWMLRASVKTIT
jgi:starvation-inducible DNA-binding protein